MYVAKSLMFLKFLGKIYAAWPLDQNVQKKWNTIYQLLWWFYFINYIMALLFTLNTCYQGRNDIELLTFSWMEVMAMVEPLIILINYKYYANILQFQYGFFIKLHIVNNLLNNFIHPYHQYLLSQTEDYLKTAGQDRQVYLKERGPTYAVMTFLILQLYGVLIILYITNPAVTTWETFLTTVYYPPSIILSPIRKILYFHQLVVMFHTSLTVVFDIIVLTLVYGCTVRLKILADQLLQANRYEELINCVREHQYILILASNTNKVVRFVALKTVLCFIGYAVGAGLQIINSKATTVSLERFGVVLLINCIRLIMTALSADDLSRTSQEIGFSVYSTMWYGDDKNSVIAKRLIMLRCQNFTEIRVAGFMPDLSLSYITGIISTAISYFTTLRAVTKS